MIKIELAFGTPAEAAAALALLAGTKTPPAETAKDPKSGKSSTAADVGAASSAKTEAAVSSVKMEVTKPADAPTYEKSGIPEKIKAMVDPNNPQANKAGVIKLLGEFGVKKGGELKPDQFDKFNAAIDKLMAGGEDLS